MKTISIQEKHSKRHSKKKKRKEETIKAKITKIDHFLDGSIINSYINDILTLNYENSDYRYYSYPRIYPEYNKKVDGLILNDENFLQEQLRSFYLIDELDLDPYELGHIKAIQFIFIDDSSLEELINIITKFELPNMILFITVLKWPSNCSKRRLEVPLDERIYKRENIRIINPHLLAEFLGLTDNYLKYFYYIIESNMDSNDSQIKKYSEMFNVSSNDSKKLKRDLFEKGLIESEFNEYFDII